MKEKIICILFVILLTFLLLCPVSVKAETDGGPYEATLNGFNGDMNDVRWYYSGSNNDGRYDYWMYTDDANCMILYCNGVFYAVTGKRDNTEAYYTIVHYSTSKNTNPSQIAWSNNGIVYSNDYISMQGATIITGEYTEYGYSYDKAFETYEDLISWLDENGSSLVDGDGNIVLPDDGDNEENVTLPAMQYNVSRKWAPKPFTNILAYNGWIEWNYTLYDLYKNDPSNYKVQMYAVLGSKSDSGALGDGKKHLILERNIVDNVISFGFDEVREKLQKLGYDNPLPDLPVTPDMGSMPYLVFVRVSSLNESNYSPWQCFEVLANSISNVGQVSIEEKDGFTKVTIDNDGDANVDDSAFHKDPNGNKTTANTDPNSAIYDGKTVSIDDVLSNIKGVADMVTSFASLLTTVYGWFPSWLITMIVASIGTIVAAGVFKILK